MVHVSKLLPVLTKLLPGTTSTTAVIVCILHIQVFECSGKSIFLVIGQLCRGEKWARV